MYVKNKPMLSQGLVFLMFTIIYTNEDMDSKSGILKRELKD